MKKLLLLCIALISFLVSCEKAQKEEVKMDTQADTETMVEEAAADTAAVDTVME